MKLSIIIPTYNEENTIRATLDSLDIHNHDVEVIVIDGNSDDKTVQLANSYDVTLLQGAKGRSRQMNKGASLAQGDILLFLHADTHLPKNYQALIEAAIVSDKSSWGYFDIKLTGKQIIFRLIERMINIRTGFTAVASGDQAIFINRDTFTQIEGYADIELMEDIATCHKLKQITRPARIKEPAITSSRRWTDYGVYRTIVLMWTLRLGYYLGINPARLKAYYK